MASGEQRCLFYSLMNFEKGFFSYIPKVYCKLGSIFILNLISFLLLDVGFEVLRAQHFVDFF